MILSISKEFTETPGGGYISQGDYSGEQFRKKLLAPRFLEACGKREELAVDLDGGYGYASSFLEEAFGGLAREYPEKDFTVIKIISEDEPQLAVRIRGYIRNALGAAMVRRAIKGV